MSDEFRFVEEPHGYWIGKEELPSPSSVFQDLALVDRRWFTEESRARGRAVHAGIHYALRGRLDWSTLHPDLHGYVRSGLALVERLQPKILRYETPLHHPVLRFAGTFDLEWELDGWRWVVDWKSGKAPKVTRYQTSSYEMLARLQEPLFNRWKRAAVELQADGSLAQIVRYEDPSDTQGWLNLLGAYRIRRALRSPDLTVTNLGE
jgi:hypothetical protein